MNNQCNEDVASSILLDNQDKDELAVKTMNDESKLQTIEKNYQNSQRLFKEVPEITAEELLSRIGRDDLVLVDVREPQEQEISMLPGAITSQDFDQNRLAYHGKTVVTYCTIGHRSGLYAQKLFATGCDVLNLKGAILSWTHAGGELVDADGPTKRVHVYNPKANLIAQGYEPVW